MTRLFISSRERLIFYTIVLLLLAVILMIPDHILFKEGNSLCIHQRLLGFQCPLCGMTRGVHELVYLHVSSAVKYNFMVVSLPVFVILEFGNYYFPCVVKCKIIRLYFVMMAVAFCLLYMYRIVGNGR